MKAHDVLDLATRNLRESLLRNSLTTLGIAVGVASLVAMLSLGIGLQTLASRRLTSSGLFDTIVVTSRRDFRGMDEGPRRRSATPDARALDDAARQEIAKIPQVVEAYPELRFPSEIRYQDKPSFATVGALTASAAQNEAFDGMTGKFFSDQKAAEAILLTDFAKDILRNQKSAASENANGTPAEGKASDNVNPADLLGREVEIVYAERAPLAARDSRPAAGASSSDALDDPFGFSVVRRRQMLRVVGIIDKEPFGGFRGMGRAGMFIPMQFAESLHMMGPGDLRGFNSSESPTYASLTVRVKEPSRVAQVQETIKKMGFSTFSLLDATRNLRRFFAVLDLFLGIFGSLALAVAALGIINTLVMAILERRRDIGIMKAIGASDADVKRLFFTEAAAMGAAGGLLGVTLGWLIGRAINFGTNIYLRRQQLPAENVWIVPWWLVAGAVAFSILVTLISGLYPAARAAKLDPVQALRYE